MTVRVCIVDDQMIFRHVVRSVVESIDGFELCGEANSGEAALELIPRVEPDLVLMDVHMPELDGLEAARRIRGVETGRSLAQTRIIALTANAFGEDREACLTAGMDDFLMKPIDRERLVEVLAGRTALAA